MPRIGTSVALLGVLGAALMLAASASANEQSFGKIERGRYLTEAADCAACHTQLGGGKPFAGGRRIETPFGGITSANITPDRETGIGSWTDRQFDDAVRRGIRPDGSRLYPAMPYTFYSKMSRDDVIAIRTYLNTIKPVHRRVETDTLPFPFNVRFAMRAWDTLFFDNEGPFKPDPTKSAEWNRGAYLVQGPGHCGACHTPKNFLGGDKTSEAYKGSALQGWFAPNITNDSTKGLGGWSADDIMSYLTTGHNRISAATGPMAEVVEMSTSHLTESDAHAIATYLKSLAGDNASGSKVAADDPGMKAGGAIYRDQCAACHALDGKGVSGLFPSLAESGVLRSSDPRSAIRIVLRGARSVATDKSPGAPGMPSFGKELTDQQIADVLTYVRNTWGHPAPAVPESAVSDARDDLANRTD
jgi:mono/diheme cytochrome c family protein